jgi:hypothetical protein
VLQREIQEASGRMKVERQVRFTKSDGLEKDEIVRKAWKGRGQSVWSVPNAYSHD